MNYGRAAWLRSRSCYNAAVVDAIATAVRGAATLDKT
jgi:hypothetical protein